MAEPAAPVVMKVQGDLHNAVERSQNCAPLKWVLVMAIKNSEE